MKKKTKELVSLKELDLTWLNFLQLQLLGGKLEYQVPGFLLFKRETLVQFLLTSFSLNSGHLWTFEE